MSTVMDVSYSLLYVSLSCTVTLTGLFEVMGSSSISPKFTCNGEGIMSATFSSTVSEE